MDSDGGRSVFGPVQSWGRVGFDQDAAERVAGAPPAPLLRWTPEVFAAWQLGRFASRRELVGFVLCAGALGYALGRWWR